MHGSHVSRRAFLALLAAGVLGAGCDFDWGLPERKPRIGLALGGGGAKGLAHVLVFEALDELGIRPYRIAGTSIGAVMGALYASGMSGQQIRELINQFVVTEEDTWTEALFRKDIFKWIEFIDPDLGEGGLLSGESFIRFLQETIQASTFSDLEIPLQVVAADVWTGEQVVFSRGQLLPAINASIAIPGLFKPVEIKGRRFVDGSTVNPVPYDLLTDRCDVTIAVDVTGERDNGGEITPSYLDTVFNTIVIMSKAIMTEKLKRRPPEVYLQPDVSDVQILEFYRADEIFRQAAPVKRELRRKLARYV